MLPHLAVHGRGDQNGGAGGQGDGGEGVVGETVGHGREDVRRGGRDEQQLRAIRERIEAAKLQAESERRALDEQAAARAHELEYERIGLDRERMSQDGQTTAEKLKIERANKSKDLQDQEAEEEGQKMDIGKMIAESMDKLHARIDQVEKKASAKRVLIRDKSGRPIASQIEGA